MNNLDRQSLGAESLDSAATGRATVGQDPSGFKPQHMKLTNGRNTMTKEQKIQEAQVLRAQGLSHRAIAERLGVQRPAVTKWLNPDAREWNRRSNANPATRAAKRAWDDKNDRRPCPQCGQLRGAGDHRRNPDGLCHDCRADQVQAEKLARRHAIERLWNLGRSLAEIGEELGTTANSIGTTLAHMRAEGGWDVPHRYVLGDNGRRIAA